DFFRNRFTREELSAILSKAGLTVGDALSRRSKVYQARQDEIDSLDDAALLDLMIEVPTLLRRPIVIGDGGVMIGHNPGKLEALISANRDNPDHRRSIQE
ncbi:MAG: hypothetical protein M3457_00840, partial [Chloroflexota bacterium]|nr:hypothetical protein [Chloroflexota bacterium]